MVTASPNVPDVIVEGNVDGFLEQAQLSTRAEQRLRDAGPDEAKRLMARSWFNQFHGEVREAKKLFVLFMNEEDIPFRAEDIAALTGGDPVETQT